MKLPLTLFAAMLLAPPAARAASAPSKDWRNLENAISEIPSEGYCDQPYDINGEEQVSFSPEFRGVVKNFRVYKRCLFTSEAVGNFRSGK